MYGTMYPYGFNDRYGDKYKTKATHIIVAKKVPSFPRKYNRINRESLHKCFCKLSPQEFDNKI